MQRLTSAAPIDDATLAMYEKTVAIIHRHLPPYLAQLYATARRNSEGKLEWWTDRQGLARPVSTLSEPEQLTVQNKRQQYQDILAGFIDQLKTNGDDKSAQALQMLLTNSRELACYDVGGEPVLVNWAIIPEAPPLPLPVASVPWWRRFLPWLLLLLLLLLLALAYWWYANHAHNDPVVQEQSEIPAPIEPAEPVVPAEPIVPVEPVAPVKPVVPVKPIIPAPPASTELTQDNPSINLAKRKDFGQIKINLTWQQGNQELPIDLDIAAFVRLKNGEIDGVEALSDLFGHYDNSPYVTLKEDLREGNNQDGEWIFVNGSHWQDIDEVLIYSFIYDGTQDWQGTDATITINVPGQPPIHTTLTNSDRRNTVAAIARLKNVDGDIKVERLNSFFRDRQSMDKHYGWGFEWTPGASKDKPLSLFR